MATVEEALAAAMKLHQAGDLPKAEGIYQQILLVDPGHADALHLLGLVAFQAGRPDLAIRYIGEALRRNPNFPTAHDNLGIVLRQQGRLEEASASHCEAIRYDPQNAGAYVHLAEDFIAMGRLDEARVNLERAVALAPGMAETHCVLGNVYHMQGRLDEAMASYRHSLQLNPAVAKTHNDIGYTLQRQGNLPEAIGHYEQVLRLAPDCAMAYANLGFALVEQEKPEEAESVCRRGLRLQANSAEIHNSLGIALKALGKMSEALSSYRQALRLKPAYADAQNNLGSVLLLEGKLDEAETCFQAAFRLKPQSAMTCTNLGHLYKAKGKFEEGVAYYRQALKIEPDYGPCHRDLANALAEEGRMAESEAEYNEALRLKPNNKARILHAMLLPPLYQSMDDLHFWRSRLTGQLRRLLDEGITLDLTREVPEPLFYLAYQGMNDRDIQRDVARLYTPAFPKAPLQAKSPTGKIRIGFISRHMKNHTIGRLMRGLIAHLSRNLFSVTVLSFGSYQDWLARFIQENCDQYIVLPMEAQAARPIVEGLGLDVLFYTDVGMEALTYSLAFSRLAPVQCVTWGHPLTTGTDAMDYFISSEHLDTEEGQEHYTEKLIRLKTLPIYYYRPQLSEKPRGRSQFRLPEERHLYSCPQSTFKFHPEFDAILARILRADPLGTIVFLEATRSHWREIWLKRFSSSHSDVVDRVHFLPRLTPEAFLELNAFSDVLLDPIHFGGGNTSYEGFAVGTPIVTLPSQFLRGRITYTLYKQMGVSDCIVNSADEYVELAVKLGTDADFRAEMSAKILEANSVLYENASGIRELEQVLQQAVAAKRARQG